MTSEPASDAVGPDLSFEEVVAALRRGDVGHWTRVYRALMPLAIEHLRRKFGSEVAREENAGGEAAQSGRTRTFLRNLKAGNWEIHDWDHLAGQFLRIATNKCLDQLKKSRRQVSWTDLGGAAPEGEEQSSLAGLQAQPLQLEQIIQRETRAEMDRVLDLLRRHLKRANPKYLEICKLRLQGQHTDEQIAATVSCSRATVQRVGLSRDFVKSRLEEANGADTKPRTALPSRPQPRDGSGEPSFENSPHEARCGHGLEPLSAASAALRADRQRLRRRLATAPGSASGPQHFLARAGTAALCRAARTGAYRCRTALQSWRPGPPRGLPGALPGTAYPAGGNCCPGRGGGPVSCHPGARSHGPVAAGPPGRAGR